MSESNTEHKKLSQKKPKSPSMADLLAMPGGDDIEFEPPRMGDILPHQNPQRCYPSPE